MAQPFFEPDPAAVDEAVRQQVRAMLRQHQFRFCDDEAGADPALLAVPQRAGAVLAVRATRLLLPSMPWLWRGDVCARR